MVRPKKKSKRVPARKRYKIEKKVREHNRKERKRVKSKPGHGKKDPGIPNLFPFKEQVLKQTEEKKRRLEECRLRQKEQRKKQHAEKRKLGSLQSLQEDASQRSKDFEKKLPWSVGQEEYSLVGRALTDGSRKAYYKEFRQVVEAADVVLEVLDARDPLGCRCAQVEESVFASGSNKRLVLILNKIDLVPPDNVASWLKYLRNEFPTIAFKASTQHQRQHLSQSKVPVKMASSDLLAGSQCLGADTLMKLLGNYCRNAGVKTTICVGIVGFPNVGKSSIINSLKRSRACLVGATPGVTKAMQEVQLDKHVKLLDCPGLVMTSDGGLSETTAVLRNCIKVEAVVDPVAPAEVIISRCQKYQVMEQYGIPEYRDVHEFLAHLARRRGKLKKGGTPDTDAAARALLQDWNSGCIRFSTYPPESRGHVSARVVSEWDKAFDMDALEKEQEFLLRESELWSDSDVPPSLLMTSSYLQTALQGATASEKTVGGNEEDSAPQGMDIAETRVSIETRVVVDGGATKTITTRKQLKRDHLNPQTNKAVKKALKTKKKRNKKFQKVVDDLEAVASGLSLSSPAPQQQTDTDSDYDFDRDLQL